ncbi:MAG: response regulator transcription factor [Bacteroidales bacterium]|nr:response regulator transcription factor [Bacteroidales bacterium]
MVNAVIIDDETKVREVLVLLLRNYCPNVHVIGQANSVKTGYEVIVKSNPNLVLLDMQLSDGNGFDLLRKFSSISFGLIIITAYQEYAIRAFKYSAIDYLLKPIDPIELSNAIDRLSKTSENNLINQQFEALLANTESKNPPDKKIVLKTIDEIHVINTSEIIRCEAHNNQTTFVIQDYENITVSKTLKEYEDLLSEDGFVRCHQTHLVNKKHVKDKNYIPVLSFTMSNGDIVPISYRKKFLLKKLA